MEKDPLLRSLADAKYAIEHGTEEGHTWRGLYLRNLWDEQRWYDNRGLKVPQFLRWEIEYFTELVNEDEKERVVAARVRAEEFYARHYYHRGSEPVQERQRENPVHGWTAEDLGSAVRDFEKVEKKKSLSKDLFAKSVRRQKYWKAQYYKKLMN